MGEAQEEAEERQRLRREAQLQQHPFVRWTTRRGGKTYGGPGVGANLSVASGAGQAQNKSSNHFNFSSNTGGHQQAKSTSLVGQGHPQGHAAHAQDKRFGKNSKGGGVSVGWAR